MNAVCVRASVTICDYTLPSIDSSKLYNFFQELVSSGGHMEGTKKKGTDARHVIPAIIVDASFAIAGGARVRGVQEANVPLIRERGVEIGLEMAGDGLVGYLRSEIRTRL